MQRKQLVKEGDEWVERYVDCGPARPTTMSTHSIPIRRADGKRSSGRGSSVTSGRFLR